MVPIAEPIEKPESSVTRQRFKHLERLERLEHLKPEIPWEDHA